MGKFLPALERELSRSRKTSTKIQSLIFFKSHFKTMKQAMEWARKKGYRPMKTHATENSFRLRIKNPAQFDFFKTISLKPGVKAVIGK